MVVRKFLKLLLCLFIGTVLILSCTSKKNSSITAPTKETQSGYEAIPQTSSQVSNDTISVNKQELPKHSKSLSLDISVNPYYDEGYDEGQEDGYNDGIENLRGDSYDDSCRYRGKKRKEYELGYEEGYEAGFDDGFADSGLNSEDEE